jgi:hypothetical protein
MRKPTIYEALAEKLRREPTSNELCDDVKRILAEGFIENEQKKHLAKGKKR